MTLYNTLQSIRLQYASIVKQDRMGDDVIHSFGCRLILAQNLLVIQLFRI